jgi:hypothetical protein
MRTLRYLLALLAFAWIGTAHAETRSARTDMDRPSATQAFAATGLAQELTAFATEAVSDEELSDVRGTGINMSEKGFVREAVLAEGASFSRQTGSISVITFDTWFADVGSRLIADNLTRGPPSP